MPFHKFGFSRKSVVSLYEKCVLDIVHGVIWQASRLCWGQSSCSYLVSKVNCIQDLLTKVLLASFSGRTVALFLLLSSATSDKVKCSRVSYMLSLLWYCSKYDYFSFWSAILFYWFVYVQKSLFLFFF